jgi:hypothetical protein
MYSASREAVMILPWASGKQVEKSADFELLESSGAIELLCVLMGNIKY